MRFPLILSWALNELHSFAEPVSSLNSVVFERIGSSRDLVCNDFLCFGAYFYSRPSLRPCSKLPPFTKKGNEIVAWFVRLNLLLQSGGRPEVCLSSLKSVSMFQAPGHSSLYCSSSEAKVRLQQKLSVIGPFAPRRREILCGSRSSRFPLFNLRLFRIPAFVLIERAALNRRFFRR